LSEGPSDGGHDRQSHQDAQDSPDQLGKIVGIPVNERIEIPQDGLTFTFEAPEVAGEIRMKFDARDSNGRRINSIEDTIVRVKSVQSFVKLNTIPFFNIDIGSHPGNGDYVLPEVRNDLQMAINDFRDKVFNRYDGLVVPFLETEGASLEWGGLLDIKRNWHAPHCGHRSGRELDLSMSVFNNYDSSVKKYLQETLQRSLRRRKFRFPVTLESPQGPQGLVSHWHATYGG
jgi:hypothetical protein